MISAVGNLGPEALRASQHTYCPAAIGGGCGRGTTGKGDQRKKATRLSRFHRHRLPFLEGADDSLTDARRLIPSARNLPTPGPAAIRLTVRSCTSPICDR